VKVKMRDGVLLIELRMRGTPLFVE